MLEAGLNRRSPNKSTLITTADRDPELTNTTFDDATRDRRHTLPKYTVEVQVIGHR